jgi:glucokinase
MRRDQRYVIGFDLGGTRLKCGAVTRDGKVLKKYLAPAEAARGPAHLVENIAHHVRQAEADMGTATSAVAFGVSGAVDPRRGVMLLPGKFRDLEGFPLVREVKKRIHRPVIAENDGRISIIAEKAYGAARNKSWAVCITLGTGVGSGVMLDGRILRERHLQFGTQVGHLVIQGAGGRLCITGARGTAETLCSATALAMAVRDGLQRGIPSVLTDAYLQDPASIDFGAVAGAVRQDDRLCKDELHRWIENVGWLLVSAVHAYAPEVIILSGGPTRSADLFLDRLREQVNRHVYRYPPGVPVPIVISKMGDFAGVLGAAALAWGLADEHQTAHA